MSNISPPFWRNEKYLGGFCLLQSIELGASGELVSAIISAYPDSVKQKDAKGRLPLVVAIESKSEFAVIDSIISAFPGALRLPYLRKLPIHMAVENGACVRTIRIMNDANPEGLRCRYYSRLPLHMLMEAQGPDTRLSVILALLEASPSSLSQNYVGKSPLFIAMEMNCPSTVVKALYDANPMAVKQNDSKKSFVRKLNAALAEASDPWVQELAMQQVAADELRAGTGYGGSVLHEALALNPPNIADLVAGLLSLDNGLITARDSQNRLPLRVAMEAGCPAKVVGALLEAFPQASVEDVGKNDRTQLPLIHLAVGFPAKEAISISRFVLENDPGSIWVRDGTGRLPLQRALENTHDPAGELATLLWRKLWDRHPSLDSSDRREREGDRHFFFEMQPGEEMNVEAVRRLRQVLAPGRDLPQGETELEDIIKACPEAVARHDEAGLLPLHYALHRNARISDVETIVEIWPDCLVVADAAGWLPLHWALYRQAPQALVLWLLQVCPEAAMHGPNLPLHIALALQVHPGVMHGVIKAYPEAVQQPPVHGIPTIQWALRQKVKSEVVLDLIDAYPAGAMLHDEDWKLPLHRACMSDAYLDVVVKLLKIFPDAALSTDKQDRTPVDYCPNKDSLAAKALRRSRGMSGDFCNLQQTGDVPAKGGPVNSPRLHVVSLTATERNIAAPSESSSKHQGLMRNAWGAEIQGHSSRSENQGLPKKPLLRSVSSRQLKGPKLPSSEVSVSAAAVLHHCESPPATPEPETMASTLDQFSQPGKWISPFSDMQLQRLMSDDSYEDDGHIGDPVNGGWTPAGSADGAWRPISVSGLPAPAWRPMSAVVVTEKNRHYTTTTHRPLTYSSGRKSYPLRPQSARPASPHQPSNGISWEPLGRASTGCRPESSSTGSWRPWSSMPSRSKSHRQSTSSNGRASSAQITSEHPGNAMMSLRSANRHTMMSPYAQHALGQLISESGLDKVGMLPNGKSQSSDALLIHAQKQYVLSQESAAASSAGDWTW